LFMAARGSLQPAKSGSGLRLERLPDALGCCRHVKMANAARAEGIDDGVHHRRQGTGAARLAATLGAKQIGAGGNRVEGIGDGGEVAGAGQGVVHIAAGERLARAVIMRRFQYRLADALGDAAMGLPLDQERVDHGAEIIDRAVARDADGAGLGVDLDLGDVAAIGKGRGRALMDVADIKGFGHAL